MSSSRSETPLPAEMREALARAGARVGRFGERLHYFESIGSSNDVALTLAEAGATEGTVVIAGAQTAGRGRRGHEWFSPPGAGLYVSVVLRPADIALSMLTLAAGVSLAEAVATSTGLAPRIKWPNDLLVARRKLAGILAEGSGAQARAPVVLGFGINLMRVAYPAGIAARATSIEHELGRVPDRGLVLAESLSSLSEWYARLTSGEFDAILDRWRELSPSSQGATVEWMTPAGPERGTTAGIDDRGALRVRIGDRVETIVGGEVIWGPSD